MVGWIVISVVLVGVLLQMSKKTTFVVTAHYGVVLSDLDSVEQAVATAKALPVELGAEYFHVVKYDSKGEIVSYQTVRNHGEERSKL